MSEMEANDPRDVDDHEMAQGDEVEPRDADASDELEAEIMQADRPFATDRFGTTAEEELAGEGLDLALAQERPEKPPTEETLAVVEEGPLDVEEQLVGDAVLERDEFASPEEAAMSVRDDVPGATDHDDPHPAAEDEAGG